MPVSTSVGQRFSQLIQYLGLSKNAFAQSLGKTATVVQHLVDERNKPGYDLLCKVFEIYPNVSKDWMLLGQGPMLTAPANLVAAGEPLPPAGELFAVAPRAAAVAPRDVAAKSRASVAFSAPAPETAAAPAAAAQLPPPGPPVASPAPEAPGVAGLPAPPAAPAAAEVYLTAALHAQHLQHQLVLAEQRNQHLLEQQRLMQQLLDLAQRR